MGCPGFWCRAEVFYKKNAEKSTMGHHCLENWNQILKELKEFKKLDI